MFEVGAGQSVSPQNSIARRSRPAAFDRQSAHAVAQRELCSYHRRWPNAKVMRVGELDLNSRATAIGIGGKGSQRIDQPGDRRAPEQSILRAQGQILRD